jgi:CDP-paratose 2-epimerase
MSRALITGGAGFIGTNVAKRLADQSYKVTVFDSLSRSGVDQNLRWLQRQHASAIQFEKGDICNPEQVKQAVRRADVVFHFAAQVAVTTSLVNPREDFEVNIGGTLNVLEAIRKSNNRPPLFFTSTNKVYGDLADVKLETAGARYRPAEMNLRTGVSEKRPLNFHSPYGCSKGAADQYVLDYSRSYDLPAVVFRMSCIYGPHQMGTEDQGWIAHFLLRAMQEEPISICGDGMQVRDALFVDDLVDAFMLAHKHVEQLSGQAFNIGGGPGNTLSLLELLQLIEKLTGQRPAYALSGWRAGDQRYYVSDTRRFHAATNWSPRVAVQDGVKLLYAWLREAASLQWPAAIPARNEHALLAR